MSLISNSWETGVTGNEKGDEVVRKVGDLRKGADFPGNKARAIGLQIPFKIFRSYFRTSVNLRLSIDDHAISLAEDFCMQ